MDRTRLRANDFWLSPSLRSHENAMRHRIKTLSGSGHLMIGRTKLRTDYKLDLCTDREGAIGILSGLWRSELFDILLRDEPLQLALENGQRVHIAADGVVEDGLAIIVNSPIAD